MKYTTKGVCSRSIEFDVVDNKVIGALVHNAGSVLVIANSALLLRWQKNT